MHCSLASVNSTLEFAGLTPIELPLSARTAALGEDFLMVAEDILAESRYFVLFLVLAPWYSVPF
jgi:hypothetical protein